MSRTVEDLYIWNEHKKAKLKMMKEQAISQSNIHKVKICPGSANILKNLHNLAEKWSDKVAQVRAFWSVGRGDTSNINSKFNNLTTQMKWEKKALKANKLKIKKTKKMKCKLIKNSKYTFMC